MHIEDDKFLSEEQFEENKKKTQEVLKLLNDTIGGGKYNTIFFASLSATEKMVNNSIKGELSNTSEGAFSTFARGTNVSLETLLINFLQHNESMIHVFQSALTKFMAYKIVTNIKQRREN